MKKILCLLLLLTILTSCTQKEEIIIPEEKSETQKYTVWLKENNFVNIYWNIVN